jgi:type I restriction enzyme, S subunit
VSSARATEAAAAAAAATADSRSQRKLPPYPRYKPSGVEWLGCVPEHWEVKRLKVSAQLTEMKVEADEENPVPYIGMENIESWTGRLLPLNPNVVPTGTANAFKKGHTLFGKLRPYLAKAFNPDFDGLCSTELLVLKGVELDRRALLYSLLSDCFIKLVDSSTYGSKMPRANWEFIGNCVLPVAPPSEQRAIAAFLDRETGRMDRLVAKKRELIERLKEKRTALISRTVTCGLPPPAARAAGLAESPPLKASGLDWLSDIPAGWEAKPLKFIALVKTGFAFSSDDFIDLGVPVLRIGDITPDGRVDFGDAKHLPDDFLRTNRDVIVRSGDIAMAMTGATIGKVGRYRHETPALLNQRVCLFRPMRGASIDFLWYLLNTDFYIEHVLLTAFGGAQPNISDTQLVACSVPVPPLREQADIAAYLDEETAKLDALVGKVQTVVERLQEYRTALITAAVTGKIDVQKEPHG